MANKDMLALDLGGPVLKAKGGSTPEGYAAALPTPGAFEGAGQLYRHFGGRMILLSQCTSEIERVKRIWLPRNGFYEQTGILSERLRFVREPEEKAATCVAEGVTHFVDDRPHILRHAIGRVSHLYLYAPDPVEVAQYPELLHHATIVQNWSELLEHLLHE